MCVKRLAVESIGCGVVIHIRDPDVQGFERFWDVASGSGRLQCLYELLLGAQRGILDINAYSLRYT